MFTPAFNLDLLSGSLAPEVTFTRVGNTATVFNSSGCIETVNADTARFDYDPLTLECKGLLIEESRTNILTNSEDFSTWPTKTNVTIAVDQINAPTNTQVADKIEETAATGSHLIFKNNSVVSGTTYTCSVFLKKGERFKARLLTLSSLDYTEADFDLDLGTATGSGKITSAGNGWYRCSITTTANTTSANGRFYIYVLNDSGVASYAGILGYGIYVFGAQVEAGVFSTSYISTGATAVTRNADVATITGTNFSDFWQASKGGAQVQAIPSTVSGIRPLVQYDDGTADNIIALRGNASNPELQVVDGGAPQVQLDAGTIVANTPYSLTGWWQTNDCKARQNSGATVSDTTATIPTVTQARLGSDGTNYLNGHLASVSYYDTFSGQIYTRRKNKAVFSLL